jgi:hypothetical protein
VTESRDPENDAEWQEAANAADFALLIDSAVQYGLVLVDGKAESGVNVERCVRILEEAKKRGILPQKRNEN